MNVTYVLCSSLVSLPTHSLLTTDFCCHCFLFFQGFCQRKIYSFPNNETFYAVWQVCSL